MNFFKITLSFLKLLIYLKQITLISIVAYRIVVRPSLFIFNKIKSIIKSFLYVIYKILSFMRHTNLSSNKILFISQIHFPIFINSNNNFYQFQQQFYQVTSEILIFFSISHVVELLFCL